MADESKVIPEIVGAIVNVSPPVPPEVVKAALVKLTPCVVEIEFPTTRGAVKLT